jgi:hypothetical protein
VAAGTAGDEEADRRAGEQCQQPDQDQLDPRRQSGLPQQQAEHDQAKAEIVGLGKSVQAGVDVGKTQQAHGAGQVEGAAADQQAGRKQVEAELTAHKIAEAEREKRYEEAIKIDPELANNVLIFPDDETLDKVKAIRTLSPEEDNEFQAAFQASLLGA